eukprot:3741890-Prymnesium_polylepis.1
MGHLAFLRACSSDTWLPNIRTTHRVSPPPRSPDAWHAPPPARCPHLHTPPGLGSPRVLSPDPVTTP